MLNLFKKSRAEQSYVVALDVGTEFVKALIVETDGRTGKIIGRSKVKQRPHSIQNGAITDIASVLENCHSAIRDAERIADVSPQQLVMGVAGELIKGKTTTITYIRKSPTEKIHLDELKNIIHKVQWKAYDKSREELAYETGHNEIDIKLVNAAIVDVRIDGYKVSNPIGFEGKELTINIFNAFTPLVHHGALQTIAAELDMELITIIPEAYALARSISSDDSGTMNAIFIDIGGGTTDIAVVKEGSLCGTKMFGLGGRSFTKRLAQELNVSFEEAEQIKVAYSAGQLEQQSSKIVRDSMKDDADVWLAGVSLTLSEFEGVDELPARVYLSGGGSKLPEIKDALESRDWHKKLPFPRKPSISFVKPSYISNLTDDTNGELGPEDIAPMALANLGIEHVGEEKVLSSLLRKVVRITT
ncbi:hypothetical protein HOG48_02610 [Candidatus Peregrinibacteria bacterium]|jgi:cell division protein FtsA|nr:hypothetical protein [Candidatus Peregrinibacteria bacterium]